MAERSFNSGSIEENFKNLIHTLEKVGAKLSDFSVTVMMVMVMIVALVKMMKLLNHLISNSLILSRPLQSSRILTTPSATIEVQVTVVSGPIFPPPKNL